MVPLAQMRTLIVLATTWALSRNALSGDAFLTHSPRPCRGAFGRNGTDASHGEGPAFEELLLRSANALSPRFNEDFNVGELGGDQLNLTAFWMREYPGSSRATFDRRWAISVLLLLAITFMIMLDTRALIADRKVKPPGGRTIMYANIRTNHLGIDSPSGCKYRHSSAADSSADVLVAAAIDLATMGKHLLKEMATNLLAAITMAMFSINHLSFIVLGAMLTIALFVLDCCWCILVSTFDNLLASASWLFDAEKADSVDSAFMMSSAAADDGWDARKYPMCPPYYGQRGIAWDCFVRDFGAAAAGKGDDDNSMEETMLGEDIGGDAPGARAAWSRCCTSTSASKTAARALCTAVQAHS